MAELERAADEAIAELRERRRVLAGWGLERVKERVERIIDTDRVEYLDRSDVPPGGRARVALHV